MHPAHQRTGPAVYTRLPTNALPPWSQTLRQWRWIFDLLQRSLDLQISWHDFGPFSHVRGKVTCHSHGGMNLNCNFNVFWTILSSGFSKKNKKHVNLGIYVYNFELLIYWVIGSLWISTFFFGFLGLEKSLFFFHKSSSVREIRNRLYLRNSRTDELRGWWGWGCHQNKP